MSLIVLILTLLLSTVVRVTDSCSSFTGWKLRHIDVEHKEQKIETEMTTRKIDTNINNNYNKNTSRMHKTIPIILQIGSKELERCDEEFEKDFCNDHGNCYSIEDIESPSHEMKAICYCDAGYSGPRCMNKHPDGEYLTVKDRTNIAQELPTSASTTTTMATKNLRSSTVRSVANEQNIGEKSPCPPPLDEDYCINGECFMIPHLSSVDYFCSCHNDFTGRRCEQKMLDFHYETVKRDRRDLSGTKKKKHKINPKFRHIT